MGAWGITMRESDYGLDLLGTVIKAQLKQTDFSVFHVTEAIELLRQDFLEEIKRANRGCLPEKLDYYGTEADQYSFYRIPKALLTDPRYKSISIEAKVLYGLLMDRIGLSVKNGWMDSDRRVYIYFTQEDAMNLMSCGKDKATKLFRELDKDGIGLIERKKQGQGRPTRIYVKNFILPL